MTDADARRTIAAIIAAFTDRTSTASPNSSRRAWSKAWQHGPSSTTAW